ncbi:hypothetical protein ILUMI_15156, partial [Ignelater luminosus]
FGWYADPIFHATGDYPEVMRKLVPIRSKKGGFRRSRLPQFTKDEAEYIKGTYDFLGLNHYTTVLTKDIPEIPIDGKPAVDKDSRTVEWQDSSWPSGASNWLKVVPWGFTKLLVWLEHRYGNVPIYITENGFSDHDEINDQGRVNYYK